MKDAKKLFDRAMKEGKTRKPFLQLGEKQEGGGVKSTGPHTVTLVSGKLGRGTDPFDGSPRDEFQMVVEEKGVEKMWNVPVKDKQGNLHYLVQRLADIDEGETIVLEMKNKGLKNYIDLRLTSEKEEVPSVQIDEGGEGTGGAVEGGEEGQDISPENFSF